MKYLLIISLFLLTSCNTPSISSWFDFRDDFRGDLKVVEDQDYQDHFMYLGELFLKNPSIDTMQIDSQTKSYLNRIYRRIVDSNELLLGNMGEDQAEFFIIDSTVPFYFSLPGSKFYLSRILLERYLSSEELFVSMLAHEMIKSRRNLYEKRTIVPARYLSIEQMISFTRINTELKMEIHKWAYFALKRAGFDSSAYLSWLQLQNKNSLDFSLQVGSSRNISQEEFMFKNFVVTEVGTLISPPDFHASSEYNRMLQELRR